MTPATEQNKQTGMRAATVISLLAGIWLFVSPWVYSVSGSPNAWNNWIVGAVIVILSAIRLSSDAAGVSWINCLLGIWTFLSPWIYGYSAEQGRFINSLCLGVIVFVTAFASATTTPHTQHPQATHL